MNYETYLPLVVFIFWVFMEPIRLYFGFKGNLREMVPDLSTFLLMVVFPQIPLIVYMSFLQPLLFTADIVVGSLMLIFLVCVFVYYRLLLGMLMCWMILGFGVIVWNFGYSTAHSGADCPVYATV